MAGADVGALRERMATEIHKVIVGQERAVHDLGVGRCRHRDRPAEVVGDSQAHAVEFLRSADGERGSPVAGRLRRAE